jgi:hypothetical protein
MSALGRFVIVGAVFAAALWALAYIKTGALVALLAFAAYGAAACALYLARASRGDDGD